MAIVVGAVPEASRKRDGPMPIVSVTKIMDSAQLARVRETTPVRQFIADSEYGEPSVVMYSVERDSLHCNKHNTDDACGCTARVRLSGILTHTVSKPRPVVCLEEIDNVRG